MALTNVNQVPDAITTVKEFHERLKAARDELGLSQKSLAEAAKVSVGTIGNLEAGTRKNPRELLAIAEALGVHPEWLKTGRGERKKVAIGSPSERSPMKNIRRVWVIGKTQGGRMPERVWTDGDQPVGATDRYAEASTADEHAFVCPVVGDSMAPRYMPGEYALVEPGTSPDLEDDVLVRLVTGETMLKRLLSRRGGIRLGSYNTSEVLSYEDTEISWMYYVAHPIPMRRIKERVDLDQHHEDAPHIDSPDLPHSAADHLGGDSQIGGLSEPEIQKRGESR